MRNGLRALGRQLRSNARKQAPWSSVHRFPRATQALPYRSYASVSAAELQFGQPLHETHPHLLKPGERRNTHSQSRFMLNACQQSHRAYQPLSTPSDAQTSLRNSLRMASPYLLHLSSSTVRVQSSMNFTRTRISST